MIKIIAHRGFWKEEAEKNSLIAFERAIKLGVGIETDVRDYQGEIVVSHDPPDSTCLNLEYAMEMIGPSLLADNLSICLNIKADGLSARLEKLLSKYQNLKYFIFDASIPEIIQYKKRRMPFLYRLSEYEMPSQLLNYASGIWLDTFEQAPLDKISLHNVLAYGKETFIVSPELHGYTHIELWQSLQEFQSLQDVYLCTDEVEDAIKLFGSSNEN